MPSRILVVDDSATIRRVVGAILERNGFDVVTAADGLLALEILTGEAKSVVDLVLLDFVMPKMNGYQFCRALRQNDTTASMPVVLMSAKSDKIREQFVQQTGAIDAITKPFDARALVAVIENALRRVNSGRMSALRLPELDEEEPLSENGASPGHDPNRVHFAAEVDDEAKSALSGDIGIIPIGAILQLLQIEGLSGLLEVSNETRSTEITVTLRAGLIDLAQSRGADDEFRLGRYFVEEGLVTPAEIERLLAKETPLVVAATSPASTALEAPPPATFAFDASTVESPTAAPSEPTMRLDPLASEELVKAAEAFGLTEEARASQSDNAKGDLKALAQTDPGGFAAASLPPPPRLGDRLLAAGHINGEQLKAALMRQSSELVYEMLRWPRGRFEFKRHPAQSVAATAKLGLTVPAVVMEGFRRVDEWRVLERTMGNFDEVLVRDDLALNMLPPEKLAKPEQAVLEAIDGARSVREVMLAIPMSSFDACRVLVQLLEARLVRRRA